MSTPRLLSIMAVLALIIAPVLMLSGGPAAAEMAPQAAMSADHCSGMGGDHDKRQPSTAHDCVMTCSAIAPASEMAVGQPLPGFAIHHPLPLFPFHGVEPEAEIPPPRFS